MKKLILITGLLLGGSTFAKTTLRIPTVLESGTSLVEINQELVSKGYQPIPTSFELSSEDQKPADKYEQYLSEISKAGELLKKDTTVSGNILPNGDSAGTCYTGAGGEPVVDLIFNLAGEAYSEQMNLWGFKFKNQSNLNPDAGPHDEIEKFLNDKSVLWKNWNGQDETVLITIAVNDDGDDVNEVSVPMCK